jgi:hypothetical protein
MMSDYMSGDQRPVPLDANSSLEIITQRNDVVFKNGAVYRGQWMGTLKQGHGV